MRSLRVRQWKIDADFHARTKTATAAGNADADNTHILALRPRSVNLSISTPSGAQPNDVMIAAVGFNNSSAAVTPPSGWTLVRRINNASTTSNALAVYRRTAVAGEPASHIFIIAGGAFLVGGIQAFSGVDTANPVDVENGQSTPSATIHDTPSVTTSTANTMLVTAHTYTSSNTWTPQSGLTEAFDRPSGTNSATGQSITGGYLLLAAAGASGTKRSTAAGNANVGNTHILALRRFIPNTPPTVSITSPASGATFAAPASITLTASAADSDGTVSKVEFFYGGTNLIATVTSPPYTFNWTNVAAGSYTLTAKATDNLTAATTSSPVNITVTGQAALYFIHPDQLNTPRVITNQAQQVVWRWDNNDAFGGNMASENPGGLGVFTFNLRFPGQYFDSETNNHYNYYRDYSPDIGRYVESDPIGLRGGVNTYLYVGGNPLRNKDPLGLLSQCTSGLDALFGGQLGRLHHEYSYWPDGNGGTVCRGYGRAPGGSVADILRGGSSAGIVLKDQQNASYGKSSCSADDNNKCMDKCVAQAYQGVEKAPPPYGWYNSSATECQKVNTTVVDICVQYCAAQGQGSAPAATPDPSRFDSEWVWGY
jgi:RHS repeat-associated protein